MKPSRNHCAWSRAIPSSTAMRRLPAWQASQPNPISQNFGDRWYDEQRSAVLIVPSVLSPFEHNVLIHQAHAETRSIRVGESLPATMDERLLELLRGGAARIS
jgi:RES domain-containing protein